MTGTTDRQTVRPTSRLALVGALVAAAALLLAACGDDGAGVRNGAAGGSGSGVGSASGVSSAECNPVGEDLADQAQATIDVELSDYKIDPDTITVEAGVVTFDVTNSGEEIHELAFLPGDGDVPFTDGHPDESALEDRGAFELEGFPPGQTCTATYDLQPGKYTLFCIITAADGETHYEKGMRGTLTVT